MCCLLADAVQGNERIIPQSGKAQVDQLYPLLQRPVQRRNQLLDRGFEPTPEYSDRDNGNVAREPENDAGAGSTVSNSIPVIIGVVECKLVGGVDESHATEYSWID